MRRFLLALAGTLFLSIPATAAGQSFAPTTYFDDTATTEVSIPTGMIASPAFVPSVMPEFAQANPGWSGLLYHGRRSLGKKGCAVFSAFILARMIADYRGDPVTFAQALRQNDGFNRSGEIEWSRVSEIVPVRTQRLYLQGQAAFDRAISELRTGNLVALQLQTPWTREHWVAGIGIEGDDVLIIDPAGGRRESFQLRYRIEYLLGLTVFRRLPIRLASSN